MGERFDTFSPPGAGYGGEPDWEAAAATATDDDGGELDPREAAALLARTTRQAERGFETQPTFLFFGAAATVLVAYGAIWLSVRHQHPYTGPSGTALGVLYGTLAVWIVVNAVVLRRALGGRSSQQRRLDAIAFATIWICVYVFQGALRHAGASDGLTYGIWPATAPLLVVGAAAAGYQAARGRRDWTAFSVAVVVLAASAAFAGPGGVWGVIGVGLAALLVAGGVARVWRLRTAG